MDTMKAAVYYGPGDIKIKEVERPHASPEGVVVKIAACGICHILDIPVWKNWPEGGKGIGLIRGHEFSGEIIEAGSLVKDFKVGDKIFTEPIYRPCYNCEACRAKDYWRCIRGGENEIGKGINGAFAEYMAIPFLTTMNAIKLPDNLNYRDLALIDHLTLGDALARRVSTDKTETEKVVVVYGMDITGLGAVALMKRKGVPKVIAIDISQLRLNAALEAGADMVIDSVNQDPVQIIMKETRGIGADSVCVCDDRPIAVFQAMNMVQNMGRVWITRPEFFRLNPAIIPETAKPVPLPPENSGFKNLAISLNPAFATLQFGFGYGYKILRFKEVIELLQSGKCTANKLVTQVFPLENIKEAFEIASDPHKSIKVLVEPREL